MTGNRACERRSIFLVALAAAAVAACGPNATVTAPGTNPVPSGGGGGGSSVHTLKVSVAGSGTVTSTPAGIDCSATGSACSATFPDGTAVKLAALPGEGFNLTGWSGACAGTTPCTVLLTGDASVTATFVAGAPPPPPPPPPPGADECAGLTPASLPAPVVATLSTSKTAGACTTGTGDDGDGAFSLGYITADAVPSVDHLFFQIKDGNAVRTGGTISGRDPPTGPVVFSQPAGFSVFSFSFDSGKSSLSTWSHEGEFVSTTQIAPASNGPRENLPTSAIGIDPSGGTAAVKSVFTKDNDWVTTYQRFDENGVAGTGEVQIDAGDHRVASVGVTLSGHVLVISFAADVSWQGRWFARDGSPLSKAFALSLQGNRVPSLQFLMDGGLALGFHDDLASAPSFFENRIADGATALEPLPPWLQQRTRNVFFAVRQGRAYATFGFDRGSCGPDQLEIVASGSGKSCGCLTVSALSRESSVGRDGSLIVPLFGTGCSYELYPKLLR